MEIKLSNDTLEKLKKLFSDVKVSEKGKDLFSVYIGRIVNPAKNTE